MNKDPIALKEDSLLLFCYKKYGYTLLCREIAFELMKNRHDFTYEELKMLMSVDPYFVSSYIPVSSTYIKAWVDTRGFINYNQFPERFYQDPDLVYHIISHARHFSSKLLRHITEDMLFAYAKEHSDEELYRLCLKISCNPKNIDLLSQRSKYASFFSDDDIRRRLKGVDPEHLDDRRNTRIYWSNEESEQKRIQRIENRIRDKLLQKTVISNGLPLIANEKTITKTRKHELTVADTDDRNIIIHYISDLHLNQKIFDQAGDGRTINEIAMDEIESAVSQIVKSIRYRKNEQYDKIILLVGDITEDFDIAKAFLLLLSEKLNETCTVLSILGNHELWNGDPAGTKKQDFHKIMNKYDKMINNIQHTFMLENSVYARTNGIPIIINEEMLFDDDIAVYLERILSKAEIVIFGGTGFSGNNDSFNATQGIYRNTIRSRKKEKELSSRCEQAYQRAVELIGSKSFICFTHMPKSDWSDDAYLPNCIYINGHTHRNNYIIDNERKILADNQIGYKGRDYSLKYFSLSSNKDHFQYLPDGVHEIHPYEYIEFVQSRGFYYSYKRNDSSKMYVLKKSGFYMFLTQSKSSLCILHGGKKEKLPKHDLNYYYNNMDVLAERLLSSFQGYEEKIQEISESICRLGGDGRIHGCIVDIDFYNHIYLNPFDGTITYYYADDVKSRISFPTLGLLIDNDPGDSPILQKLKKALETDNKTHELVQSFGKNGTYSEGYFIYRISNKVKKIQNLFDGNIIQIWDDSIINEDKHPKLK